ncbi:cation:proton antiporter [Parabacteroides sp. Marseille-P3160]|uniref:cation:proton antiporter n=1 Tax=Parabacteroides sp. Marseille-P3160 TaxID=1917887 RepID=UPI0009B9D0AE|nr:cation:proton antiporter [Parabacteroides sp. Marseille-P3160]
MSHLPTLVTDLALILITAGIVTVLFKLIKQPVVLGYIVAGLLISPHFMLLPSVADPANISQWAEIGVIFLLFALGLEFSFKKLIAVGGTASIATAINMGSMITIGYIVGQLMGWTNIESLFLGGMLSMSSTTIIIKAFVDMGLQKKKFAGIVFGMLIVEDLAAILMMVLFTTLAVSKHFEGMELIDNILKLLFFILIWFIVGIYLIPTILKKLKAHMNDETLLVISVALCLGMVWFADAVGFSAALGAFIMGSILAETIEARHIEHLIEPLKNLFGAVFFVSVGMMIAPEVIVEYAVPILILTVVVLIGRVIFATLGVLASGQGLNDSLHAGFSLAQIGEFSFIIATLGMQLGVISDYIYPVIVAVSVITTFTTPYFIRAANPISDFIEARIPKGWNKLIIGYAASNQKNVIKHNSWQKILRNVLVYVSVYFSLSLAILFIARKFLKPVITSYIPDIWGSLLYALVTLLIMAPFMSGIMKRKNKTREFKELWEDNHLNKAVLIALTLLRFGVCVILVFFVLIPLFPQATSLLLVISGLIAIAISFIQGFGIQSKRMEQKFLDNLHRKERIEDSKRTINLQTKDQLLRMNIHIEEIEVPPNSCRIGKTLAELNFKQETGVNIVSIIRGAQKINIPTANDRLYPFDRIILAGTDENIQKFTNAIEDKNREMNELVIPQHQVGLGQLVIESNSPLLNRSIRDLKLREKTECMIIGISRNNEYLTDFAADTVLLEGDVLTLAGEKKQLANLLQQYENKAS